MIVPFQDQVVTDSDLLTIVLFSDKVRSEQEFGNFIRKFKVLNFRFGLKIVFPFNQFQESVSS